jgi:hypothetical protein
MGCGRVLALATRGHICQTNDEPFVVDGLSPEVLAVVLEPYVGTGSKDPPKFVVRSVEIEPQPICAQEDMYPTLRVTYVPQPVPDARTREPKETPSGKIRPIEDLVPVIKKKDD